MLRKKRKGFFMELGDAQAKCPRGSLCPLRWILLGVLGSLGMLGSLAMLLLSEQEFWVEVGMETCLVSTL